DGDGVERGAARAVVLVLRRHADLERTGAGVNVVDGHAARAAHRLIGRTVAVPVDGEGEARRLVDGRDVGGRQRERTRLSGHALARPGDVGARRDVEDVDRLRVAPRAKAAVVHAQGGDVGAVVIGGERDVRVRPGRVGDAVLRHGPGVGENLAEGRPV